MLDWRSVYPVRLAWSPMTGSASAPSRRGRIFSFRSRLTDILGPSVLDCASVNQGESTVKTRYLSARGSHHILSPSIGLGFTCDELR
jgi:hypothetical protein